MRSKLNEWLNEWNSPLRRPKTHSWCGKLQGGGKTSLVSFRYSSKLKMWSLLVVLWLPTGPGSVLNSTLLLRLKQLHIVYSLTGSDESPDGWCHHGLQDLCGFFSLLFKKRKKNQWFTISFSLLQVHRRLCWLIHNLSQLIEKQSLAVLEAFLFHESTLLPFQRDPERARRNTADFWLKSWPIS